MQYGFIHDLRKVADGTAMGAVALAKRAGLAGILCKYADGHATVAGDGSGTDFAGQCRALAAPCATVGLELIPWAYVYPTDADDTFARIVNQALLDTQSANGKYRFLIDAESEFDNAPAPGTAADAVLHAIRSILPGAELWLTSWAWCDQHPNFPFAEFAKECAVYMPQAYPALIGVSAQAVVARAIATIPHFPRTIPAFDLSSVGDCARLSFASGWPDAAWWLLDGMTEAQAQSLAAALSWATPVEPTPAPEPPAVPVAASTTPPGPVTHPNPVPPASGAPASDRAALLAIKTIIDARLAQN